MAFVERVHQKAAALTLNYVLSGFAWKGQISRI
jgi:hypothetical protein